MRRNCARIAPNCAELRRIAPELRGTSRSSTALYICIPKSSAVLSSVKPTLDASATSGNSYSGPPFTSQSASARALPLTPPLNRRSTLSDAPGASTPRIGRMSKAEESAASAVPSAANDHENWAGTFAVFVIVTASCFGVPLSTHPKSARAVSNATFG